MRPRHPSDVILDGAYGLHAHDEDEDDDDTPTAPSAPGPAFVTPQANSAYRDALEAQLARANSTIVELGIELTTLRAAHNTPISITVTKQSLSPSAKIGVFLLIIAALVQFAAFCAQLVLAQH